MRAGTSLRWFSVGFGLGLGAHLLLERRGGARRRAMLRDKTLSWARAAALDLQERLMDARWRMRGLAHEALARLEEQEVDDDVLVERVKAQIGRAVAHPGALEVHADNGAVILSGPVLAYEVPELLARTQRVRGVRQVVNRLDVRTAPGRTPALQGAGSRQARG